jgi:taurine dioxygenase
MEIRPLSTVMGAEVRGIDLSRPLDDDAFGELLHAFHRHMLLVFPAQRIDEAQQIAFSRRFGELQVHVLDQYRHPRHPEIFVQSNVDRKTGETTGTHPDKGSLVWHSDLSFLPRPALATSLYGIEVPDEGGDTLFADMCAAYDALDQDTKALLGTLKAVHDISVQRVRAGEEPMTERQRAEAPPVEHPAVRTHPATGRKALYLSRHCSHVVGLPPAQGIALLERIQAHATSERFVYRHRWRVHDVVIWDNRCTIHSATPYDALAKRRILHRTVMKGDAPV